MKYIVLVGDGMGDYPIAELNGQTPLAAAHTPYMDHIAAVGRMGLARTIPQGCEPGSDTANLSLLGYDPRAVQTRRGPLEAASMGVNLGPKDVAFRCNLVSLVGEADDLVMADYSAGHIGTDDARQLIATLARALGDNSIRFYPGVGYRHLMVWHGGNAVLNTIPPHDITGQRVAPYLGRLGDQCLLLSLMERARVVLADHPVNKRRLQDGQSAATDLWFWGQGYAPGIGSFGEKTGLKGAIISAVDLLRGMGVYMGLDVINVPGATGYLDTNYLGKAEYGLAALKDVDFVFVHVEAPDEASHEGNLQYKLAAIEAFDSKVVGTVLEGIRAFDECRVLVTTDHFTPVSRKTHTIEPVPFAMAGALVQSNGIGGSFSEVEAMKRGLYIENGYELLEQFLGAA